MSDADSPGKEPTTVEPKMGKVIQGEFRRKEKLRAFHEMSFDIISAIDLGTHPFPRSWPHIYHTMEPSPGVKLIYKENDGEILTQVPVSQLANDIIDWVKLFNMPECHLAYSRAEQIAETWRAGAKVMGPEWVKPLRWKSEEGYCWDRLPFDQLPYGGPCPTWDSLLSRMTNAEAFLCFVGSLFYKESSLHNYCWVYGDGNDGKGAISRFLARVFGKSFRSKQAPDRNTKIGNWLHGIVGARLVCFPDCNNASFAASGIFKSITGGDHIEIEAKYQMPYTTQLDAKFIFFSNHVPNLSSERADMRRVIYCEFTEPGTYDPEFEEKLWREAAQFISTCCELYINTYPNHGPIQPDMEGIKDIVEDNEAWASAFFEKHFRLVTHSENVKLNGKPLTHVNQYSVSGEQMNSILENIPQFRQQDFRAWLARRHGIKRKTVRVAVHGSEDVYVKRYVGVALINNG